MVTTTVESLPQFREKYKNKTIVFCSGTFDMPHAGHIIFFEDCKKLGDILFVAVGDDIAVRKNRGADRPILNEHIRLKTIDSFKPVDYSFLITMQDDHKLSTIGEVLEKLKPDVYVVNEDAFDMDYRQELAKKFGVKLIILKRHCPAEFENISATSIIKKIKALDSL